MNAADPHDELAEAAALVRQCTNLAPRVGIVLGSGQGGIVSGVEHTVEIAYGDLPGAPVPTAVGHQGKLVVGEWRSCPCIVACGRCHLYEGRTWNDVTYVVRLMLTLGVRRIIVTNAAGGLHPLLRAGQIMVIRDHLNLMFRGFLSRPTSEEARGTRAAFPYDAQWSDAVMAGAWRSDMPVVQGVYAGVLGPNYETRAEYRMLRKLGADAVGMSTIPEAIVASEAGASVLGLSVITNEAKPDAPQRVTHEEVIDWALKAEQRLTAAIETGLEYVERS